MEVSLSDLVAYLKSNGYTPNMIGDHPEFNFCNKVTYKILVSCNERHNGFDVFIFNEAGDKGRLKANNMNDVISILNLYGIFPIDLPTKGVHDGSDMNDQKKLNL